MPQRFDFKNLLTPSEMQMKCKTSRLNLQGNTGGWNLTLKLNRFERKKIINHFNSLRDAGFQMSISLASTESFFPPFVFIATV